MPEILNPIRAVPRLPSRDRSRFHPPPDPPDHLRRMAALRRRYRGLGIVGAYAGARPTGRPLPVVVGGTPYPSARAAERAIGASRGQVSMAVHRGGTCRGLACEPGKDA